VLMSCGEQGEILTSVAYHHRQAHVLYGGTVDGRLVVFEWKSAKCVVKALLTVEKFSRYISSFPSSHVRCSHMCACVG